MFLLVPAYPGCPGSKAVKRSSLLLSFFISFKIKYQYVREQKFETNCNKNKTRAINVKKDNLVSYLSSMQNNWMLNALLSPKYCGTNRGWADLSDAGFANCRLTETGVYIQESKLNTSQ